MHARRSGTSCRSGVWAMTMRVHVLDEKKSPPEALIWTMWCGAQCVAEDGGMLTPILDFYLEREASKSDCVDCLKRLLGRPVDVKERVGAE